MISWALPVESLPLHESNSPQSSPSFVTLSQERGGHRRRLRYPAVDSEAMSGHDVQGSVTFQNDSLVSPTGSQLTRSSSIYSTESAESTDSADTTISEILDMYIDLVSKIPCGGISPGSTIIQPKAYRDTVAPLLRRRFSTERMSMDFTCALDISPILPLRPSNKPSKSSLNSSYKQAPGFQEFSRNLRDRRTDLVSSFTLSSSGNQSGLIPDTSSEPSPPTPPRRPFSFAGDENTRAEQCLRTSSLLDRDAKLYAQRNISKDVHRTEASQPRKSSVSTQYLFPGSETPRYVSSSDIVDLKTATKKYHVPAKELPQSNLQGTSRYYRHRSVGSDSAESLVTRTGVGGAVKAVVKEKFRRRREAKEKASIMATASQKYPAMRLDPNTPHQKYGSDLWMAMDKKKCKEEHQQEGHAHESGTASPQSRRKSRETHEPGHRRTSSAKTSDTVSSQTLQAKNGLMAMVENARSSLTHSSAEKRRGRLKESIVLVGPTQLTIANAQDNKSRRDQPL